MACLWLAYHQKLNELGAMKFREKATRKIFTKWHTCVVNHLGRRSLCEYAIQRMRHRHTSNMWHTWACFAKRSSHQRHAIHQMRARYVSKAWQTLKGWGVRETYHKCLLELGVLRFKATAIKQPWSHWRRPWREEMPPVKSIIALVEDAVDLLC